ncbi:hypothetical protein OAB17_00645 [Flavobacteriaceae bacterium]|jgi:hypothetical protein|nr:hypothetical protein [Flavobacteriaceae bacterium]MDB9780416.1 hypothetical protein [Flavobacteriaceae bacterium]MDB9798768.1 hypothetical protein [Flavobacteriaceae bacterium]|tara:strand:- start:319 stop:795 length:477 start_codon:yes stop_codon:yes gene_type:complete
MKFKIIAPLLICTLTFISCASLEDGPFVGFKLDIINKTDNEIQNAKILIGGMQNGEFVSTESFELPTIIIRPNESFYQVVAFDENRWKPDLSLIAEISNRAYFAFQFENGNQVLLLRNSDLFAFEIEENNNLKLDFGAMISISVFQNSAMISSFYEDI